MSIDEALLCLGGVRFKFLIQFLIFYVQFPPQVAMLAQRHENCQIIAVWGDQAGLTATAVSNSHDAAR